jgi:2,3-bisphosphoglycerate-dependent phosphoglycerate mutase
VSDSDPSVTVPPATKAGYRQHRFSPPPGAADLIVVRHGESAPQTLEAPYPLVNGRSDPPLHDTGQQEARLLAGRLQGEDIAAIYVTDLRRTAETAAPLAAALGITPRVEPDLAEVHLGEWESTFRMRVAEGDPIARRMFAEERWDVIPGAESTEALQARIRAGIERIAAAHRDQRVVVVTHGGVIGAIVSMATGARPFAFVGASNASITHVVVTDDRWIVRRFNDTGHLGTDLDRPPEPLT